MVLANGVWIPHCIVAVTGSTGFCASEAGWFLLVTFDSSDPILSRQVNILASESENSEGERQSNKSSKSLLASETAGPHPPRFGKHW